MKMNLENYVCTLEQSKKLDKLLGKRESIFVWRGWKNPRHNLEEAWALRFFADNTSTSDYDWQYSAYTSQELSEIIQEHGKYSSLWRAAELAEFLIYLLESKNG